MSSCERPWNRSASDAVPSSVSKRYSLSIRTQGSSWRRRASSSLRRTSSFSASSSSRRAASHSSRVPDLWLVIGLSPSYRHSSFGLTRGTDDALHRRHQPGNRRRREDDPDTKRHDRQRQRTIDGGSGGL